MAPHANAVLDMMSHARAIANTTLWPTLAANAFNDNITKMNNGDLSAKAHVARAVGETHIFFTPSRCFFPRCTRRAAYHTERCSARSSGRQRWDPLPNR